MSEVTHESYADGLRDGKVAMLERMAQDTKGRLDNHAIRLRLLERIVWGVCGAAILIELLPQIARFLEGAA